MLTLFSIGKIQFDIGSIISFFSGMLIGFFLLLLLYIYAVLKSLNKGLRKKGVQEEDIDEDEIKWLIEDAQKQFKDKSLRNSVGFSKHLTDLTKELVLDIATKFYPNSKYPHLELTIDESLMLSHYITNRIDEIFSSKILSLLRGMTLRKIASLSETKTSIEETKVVKTAKKMKLTKALDATMKVVNAVNPFYWFKKIAINSMINLILVKIGLTIIAVTGEETYKIYSKKVFNVEKEIDTGIDELYKNIAKEVEDINDEE